MGSDNSGGFFDCIEKRKDKDEEVPKIVTIKKQQITQRRAAYQLVTKAENTQPTQLQIGRRSRLYEKRQQRNASRSRERSLQSKIIINQNSEASLDEKTQNDIEDLKEQTKSIGIIENFS